MRSSRTPERLAAHGPVTLIQRVKACKYTLLSSFEKESKQASLRINSHRKKAQFLIIHYIHPTTSPRIQRHLHLRRHYPEPTRLLIPPFRKLPPLPLSLTLLSLATLLIHPFHIHQIARRLQRIRLPPTPPLPHNPIAPPPHLPPTRQLEPPRPHPRNDSSLMIALLITMLARRRGYLSIDKDHIEKGRRLDTHRRSLYFSNADHVQKSSIAVPRMLSSKDTLGSTLELSLSLRIAASLETKGTT